MTREEAINLIDINRSNLKATNAEGFSKDIEALDMAIEALEQDSVIMFGISRQEMEDITNDVMRDFKKEVLDEMRNEMSQLGRNHTLVYADRIIEKCLKIIDRYKDEDTNHER